MSCGLSGIERVASVECMSAIYLSIYDAECVIVNHVPKCMSFHKPIVMITGRGHNVVMTTYTYILCSSCFWDI